MIRYAQLGAGAAADLWTRYGDLAVRGAMSVLAAAAILVAGLWLAGRLGAATRRLVARHPRMDDTLAAFFSSIVRYGLIALVIVAVLQTFGIPTASIVAVLGAATLAVGLALQGTLSNVAAGVMLVLFRPYRIGDAVEVSGKQGVVRDMTLFTTELRTFDGLKITLPNAACWGAPIINYSGHDVRRIDLEFGVGYEVDLDRACAVVRQTLAAEPRVLSAPPALVKVSALGDFAVTILVHAWAATPDWFETRLDLIKAVKEAFDRAGVTIPYPTAVQYAHELPPIAAVPSAPRKSAP